MTGPIDPREARVLAERGVVERQRRGGWGRWAFAGCWGVCSAGLGWQIARSEATREPSSWVVALALAALLACTVSLVWWLGWPSAEDVPANERTRRWWLTLLVLGVSAALVALVHVVGPGLLFGIPVTAGVVIILLRRWVTQRDAVYALLLALAAGVTGLGAGWIEDFSPWAWAALQVALVGLSLPAGWALLRATGLAAAGLGRTVALERTAAAAARAFGLGLLIGLPWALGNVVLAEAGQDEWATAWWSPVLALQPGIAEEAWARVLLVPLLYVMLARVARGSTALSLSIVVIGVWFGYLHTYDQSGAVISAIMLGGLFALPLTVLWLRHDLETAIGMHTGIDAVRFLAAYLFNQGLWFGG